MSNPPLPPVAFFTRFRVADFDHWKTTFEASRDRRTAVGILGHHIQRGADDPNRVAIYLPAKAAAPVEAMYANPEFQAMLKKNGVEGAPTTAVLEPVENDVIGDRAVAGVVVTADVEDYASWKKGYDGGAQLRKNLGVIGHAVNRVVGRPNTVVVLHQGETVQALRDFIGSADVKAAMKGSGVQGVPQFEFYDGTGAMAMY
jgi:hypothetical protein